MPGPERPRQLPWCRGRRRLAQAGTGCHYLGPVLRTREFIAALEVQGAGLSCWALETKDLKAPGDWEAGSWTPPGVCGAERTLLRAS